MADTRPLGRILEGATALDPDRPALVVSGETSTYGELDEAAGRCAAGLGDRGVGRGVRFAIADDATVLSVACLVGAARIGAVPALMNPRLTGGELAELGAAAGTASVGVAGRSAARALSESGVTTVLGAAELLGGGVPAHAAPSVDPRPEDDAVVLFTSGTTGTPKAIPLSHGLVGPRIAAFSPEASSEPAVALLCVPLVHIGGMLGLLVALARGSTTVVLSRFDAGEWLRLVERHRVNTSFVVPTMLHRILDHPDFDRTDLSSLTALAYGAAPASPDLVKRAMDRLPGVALTNTFGQTETMGSITALAPDDHTPERLASVGRPLPGVEIRILEPGSGEPVVQGAVGELWVRAAGAVAAPAAPDGWLRTGDLVSEDADGYLYPAGRLSDTINRGGEKFAPIEVEAVLRDHEAVREVAVVGVPDPEMGSRVGAAVVASRPVTVDELRRFCTGRLATFKQPEAVVVVDELPYNDFGKVDRRALRALLADGAR